MDSLEDFKKWFVVPIAEIKKLPNGDGGFVAFIVAIVLYERLIKAKLKSRNVEQTDENVRAEASRDLKLSLGQTTVFWDMFRNGLLHQGMPKAGKTNYAFQDSYSAFPVFKPSNGHETICINPWKFAERIIAEFVNNPQLINSTNAYPFPYIGPLPLELLGN